MNIGSAKYLFFGKCFKKTTEYESFRLIMENNFIQMAASSAHAVAYVIGPIFKHIIDCVQLYLQLCAGLLDVRPGFVYQVKPQNEIWKTNIFLQRFLLSRFLAKTLSWKSCSKIYRSESMLNCRREWHEKLCCNPDWRVVMAKYVCIYFSQKKSSIIHVLTETHNMSDVRSWVIILTERL